MRWLRIGIVVLGLVSIAGCQQTPQADATVDLDGSVGIDVREEQLDAFVVPPDAFVVPPDAFARPDAPYYVDGARVYLDGETPPDAYLAYDGGNLCGFDAASDTFVCGGTDPWPADCESPTYCCHGICDPFGTDEVCCNRSTGTITVYRYMSGMCPLNETRTCT
jgi:hypothetical protein